MCSSETSANLTENKLFETQQNLNIVNEFITEQGLYLDPESKIATRPAIFRSYERNNVEVHWNYVRVHLNRDLANMAKMAL